MTDGRDEVVAVWSFADDGPLGDRPVERFDPTYPDRLVGTASAVGAAAIDGVVRGAHAAFGDWRARPIDERVALGRAAADAVAATADRLGPLLARELGKVVGDCRGEMGFAAACLRWCAEEVAAVAASTEVDDAAGRLAVHRVPYGVVGAVVPWNAPLILSILKVAPAVLTGNTIVVKPSPLAPLAVTEALGAIAAALPPGVVSVVHGDAEVGDALVSHPLVRKVSFTGGPVTAVTVAAAAARTIKPVVLELGGNDPAIFLDDAPFDDDLMERAVFGAFLTSGQVCMAAKRAYVPRARLGDFVDAFVAAADRVLEVGDPLSPTATMGPLVTAAARDRVAALVDGAVAAGATAVPLGRVTPVVEAGGWFLRPTLVLGATAEDPIVRTEQFGPTLPVLAYDDLDEAIAAANDSEMGLASSVWSADEDRAFAVARRLEAGTTFVNCHNRAGMSLRAPFGGVKQSGVGREFGLAGLSEYVQTHAVHAPATVRGAGTGGAANAYPNT